MNMKNITTSKYTQRRIHRGVVIEQTGIAWTAWMDYVHQSWMQPRFASLTAATAAISSAARS